MKLDIYFSFYSLLRIFLQAIKLKGIHIIKHDLFFNGLNFVQFTDLGLLI